MNVRKAALQKIIHVVTNRATDVRRVNALLSFGVDARWDDAIDEKRYHVLVKRVLKKVFHVPGAFLAGYFVVGRMVREEGASKELTGQHLQMVRDWQHLGLGMEMILRGHLVGTGGETKRRILDRL